MCDIEIAAQHQGLLHVQLAQVCPEVHVPGFAVIQAHKAFTGVWHVSGHQVEVGELGSDDTTLLVMLFFAWRVGNRFKMFSVLTTDMKGNSEVESQHCIFLCHVQKYVTDNLSLKFVKSVCVGAVAKQPLETQGSYHIKCVAILKKKKINK